jgi:hypothetical protein
MRRNLLWCILGTQSRERRPRPGRCGQPPPCPPTPRRRPGLDTTPSWASLEERPDPRDGGGENPDILITKSLCHHCHFLNHELSTGQSMAKAAEAGAPGPEMRARTGSIHT